MNKQQCRYRDASILFLLFVLVGCVLMQACAPSSSNLDDDELQAYEAFFNGANDSITIAPHRLRSKALQQMQLSEDPLAACHYMTFAAKTCMVTSDIDSAFLLINQVEHCANNQPQSAQLNNLKADCANLKGNLYARLGNMDSSSICFEQAFSYLQHGGKKTSMPDILINLADVNNRLGKLDVGAYWYRRALILSDSLQLPPHAKTPIYYGLAQVYVALRDFEQCDSYYNRAAEYYDEMQPFEQHFYLNNRGTSYYYRDDFSGALSYFRRVLALTAQYPEMNFERNLAYLNMSDCFLHLEQPDSASYYLKSCEPYFRKIGMTTAIYYIDTQRMQLALLQNNLREAGRILANSRTPHDIDPDMLHIRNNYLQKYYEATGNHKLALRYLTANKHLDDSIRNERIRLRTADLALRYQQDSIIMAHQVLIREAENKLLKLRWTTIAWSSLAIIVFLLALFQLLYNKKKRELLAVENQRTVSSLRLENIRNRLSPHFIFNVLSHEMSMLDAQGKHELSTLVKLMRRNLELAEQLCVTLTEELDFVKTYLKLEERSLGSDFTYHIELAEGINPDDVYLPSMLIQIPVENAVKHALRNKDGARCLWIKVGKQQNGVTISVVDNGGGYRVHSAHRGTGTGMKVVLQTIQILNARNKEKIDVAVHNRTSPNGETGCDCTFFLPSSFVYVF